MRYSFNKFWIFVQRWIFPDFGERFVIFAFHAWREDLRKIVESWPYSLCESSSGSAHTKNKLTWSDGWQPNSRIVLTTPTCPLLTAIWRAVWRLLLRALRSAPAAASNSITAGSSPKAAWCTARSPSLSYEKQQKASWVQCYTFLLIFPKKVNWFCSDATWEQSEKWRYRY